MYVDIIKKKGSADGTFLIRNSSKKKRFFVLSMLWKKKGKISQLNKNLFHVSLNE